MTSKAVSKIYKCNPAKKPRDGNPYVQVDIDRLIGYMYGEIEKINELLADPELTIFVEHPAIREEMECQVGFYEGLIGTIEANSFK